MTDVVGEPILNRRAWRGGELQERAESEGASGVQIEKKHLKSGREIWILHGEE